MRSDKLFAGREVCNVNSSARDLAYNPENKFVFRK